jgi:hypothetical protein
MYIMDLSKNPHHDPYTFSTFALSPFKALYTNIPHPVDKPQYHHFCLYLCLKTTKTQRG